MTMGSDPIGERRATRSFWWSIAALAVIGGFVAGLSGRTAKTQATAEGGAVPAVATTQARPKFLQNLPGMVDRTVRFVSADDFSAGRFESSKLEREGRARVVLNDVNPRAYPREGTWTTPTIKAELPFTEFLPSWNADVPADCGVAFEARVRDHERGTWSPWLYVGSWGRPLSYEHVEKFEGGRLNVDNLQLTRPCDAFEMRVKFASYGVEPTQVPSLRRLHVIYSGMSPESERAKWERPALIMTGWDRNLPVPYRPQGDAPPALAKQVCSPTSTSMVMQYWGVDRPTVPNALAIWDDDHKLFGNWGRAVQFAGSLGLDAWLERFRSWDQVKAKIAEGQPVVASIRFNEGEFPSSVLKSSKGHLIVIRGFTKDGDAICNDPGNRARGNNVVYKANELGHAWFDHGGVGYIIKGPTAVTTQPTTKPTVAAK